MRADYHLSMLLIEREKICREILLNQIMSRFPRVDVETATNYDEALLLLNDKEHDIVICDALLARDERMSLALRMRDAAEPIIIIISVDTDVRIDSFPAAIKDIRVQHIAYKPLDIRDLMQKIRDAVERVKTRKTGRPVMRHSLR